MAAGDFLRVRLPSQQQQPPAAAALLCRLMSLCRHIRCEADSPAELCASGPSTQTSSQSHLGPHLGGVRNAEPWPHPKTIELPSVS